MNTQARPASREMSWARRVNSLPGGLPGLQGPTTMFAALLLMVFFAPLRMGSDHLDCGVARDLQCSTPVLGSIVACAGSARGRIVRFATGHGRSPEVLEQPRDCVPSSRSHI